MSETEKVEKSEMEEIRHEGQELKDEADAKGFAEYVLSTITGKKKAPVESSTSPTHKKPLNSSDKADEKPVKLTYSGTNQHDEEYHMLHRRRGVALIFNHSVFHTLAPREGTKKDCGDLERELTQLGFEVRVHNDLKQSKIKTVLEETSNEDHSDADCLAVFVMSHGEAGYIFARDSPYREELLWHHFTGKHCYSLRGKPKLFFIQACRGDRVDAGVRVAVDSSDSAPMTYTIPTEADILVAYSTVKEYFAWRSPKNGSWYVQALCEELRSNGQTRDLLAILTFVNRRVAIEYISNVPGNDKMNMKVQMPTFSSMLTRLVYFRQKQNEPTGKRKNINTSPPAKQSNLTEHKQLTKKEEKTNRRF